MMNRHLLALATCFLAGSFSLTAQEILTTDFAQAEVKTYANEEILGKGGTLTEMTVHTGLYDGGNGQWTDDSAVAESQVRLESLDGDRFLTLTAASVSKSIPDEISKKQDLKLRGSLVFTPQSASGGGDFLILLTENIWSTTGTATIASISISPDLRVKYYGGIVPDRLSANTAYRLDFTMEFTDQSHTWEFTISEVATPDTPLFSSGNRQTRNPDALPNSLVLNQLGSSSEPLVQIRQLTLTSLDPGPTN